MQIDETKRLTITQTRQGATFKDATGQIFGRLTALRWAGRAQRVSLWECSCECGNTTIVTRAYLIRSNSPSCGCWYQIPHTIASTVHGEYSGGKRTDEARAYARAKERCENPNNIGWLNYGGRGIEFRFSSIQMFIDEVGRRPSKKHSIDRIDVNGHYEHGNVRWATMSEQGNNRRNNRLLTVGNETRTISEWASVAGLFLSVICGRLRRGWCAECAVYLPALAYNECKSGGCPHRGDK